MTLADAMVQSQKIWARKPADFYATPYNVTIALLDEMLVEPGTLVWEPAAGDGDMVFPMRALELAVVGSDIRETRFLECDSHSRLFNFLAPIEPVWIGATPKLIISNPPFALAEEFIRRALQICDDVAMLVRSQYWHAASRQKLFEENRPYMIHPLTWRPAFEEEARGGSPLMDVSWITWHGRGRTIDPIFRPLPRPDPKRMREINEYCAQMKVEYGIPLRNTAFEKFIRKAMAE